MKKAAMFATNALSEPDTELERFAAEVMDELVRQSIPPTPSNFQAFFEKGLDGKPAAFKKNILRLLELEEGDDNNNTAVMEHSIKEGLGHIRKLLHHLGLAYKNIRHLESVAKRRKEEMAIMTDQSEFIATLDATLADLGRVSMIIKKEAEVLKKEYEATTETVQAIESHTVYDERFGIYKKHYLLEKAAHEVALVKEFRHESSLMMVRVNREVLKSVDNTKVRFLIARTIARLLMKTSRRSDVVAHYGGEVFAILLRHTNLENAGRAAKRLIDQVGSTNFFIGDSEIVLSVEIGISRVDGNRLAEESIVCALESIEITKKSMEEYGVCLQDIEL